MKIPFISFTLASLLLSPPLPAQEHPFSDNHVFSGAVDTAWVRHYARWAVPSDDDAHQIAVDTKGNVYVTGSVGSNFGADYGTVKYDASGNLLWANCYNDLECDGFGITSGLAVDASGQAYVAGYSTSYDGSSPRHFITIKYGTAGETLWVRRYDAGWTSPPREINAAVDENGNVYVCGSGQTYPESIRDVVTIKYSPDGDTVWTRHFKGPGGLGNADEKFTSLAVDAVGNIYVACCTFPRVPTSYDGDYATIKYNSSGDTVWVRRYNGPANSDDHPTSLGVDANGNIYVTGFSVGQGSIAPWEYSTVKYNSAGDTVWVRRYSVKQYNTNDSWRASLAVDARGNVYVAGYTYDSTTYTDYLTLKYNTDGESIWVRQYGGQSGSTDHATSLAVDSAGNVYVTGSSEAPGRYDYATIKYNAAGDSVWVRRYDGQGQSTTSYQNGDNARGIALDTKGNVYVTGTSFGGDAHSNDFATLKYDASGTSVWVRSYDGPRRGSAIRPNALDVDAGGNVYVAGASYGGSFDRPATVKLSTRGELEWAREYIISGDNPLQLNSVRAAPNGDVFVTGVSEPHSDSGMTVKYRSDGVREWAKPFFNTSGLPSSLVLDADGNACVTGKISQAYGSALATIKYDKLGEMLWAKTNPPRYVYGSGASIAVDPAGYIYVTGSDWNPPSRSDFITIKRSPTGDSLWLSRYSGPWNGANFPKAIFADAIGNVYVTGLGDQTFNQYGTNGGRFVTIKYTTAGDAVWVRYFRDLSVSVPCALVADSSGIVYVSGYSELSPENRASQFAHLVTIKYDSRGDTLWVRRRTVSWHNAAVSSVALDQGGNVYVVGSAAAPDSGVLTIKYNSSGEEIWEAAYPSGSDCVGIKVEAAGPVYIVCANAWRLRYLNQCCYTVVKYLQYPTSVKGNGPTVPTSFALQQNFPNPFNLSTTIEYQLPASSKVKLSLFDVLGREVSTLIDEAKPAGVHTVRFHAEGLANGVYICRMTVPTAGRDGRAGSFSTDTRQSFVDVKKLILLK